ncbi:MAG: adenylate/guanylate cyclase domain-containing protein, partial [Caulobacteraceae bacterium]|nr:adenylate/guanylate cyclase domain-containing protein [Caulobacter sp.]
HLALIRDVVPVCALAAAKLAVTYTFRRTLGTYLGNATGEEVLGGRITRGEGRTIWAAILLVDLRGFNALADSSAPMAVVGWLDDHLEALGQPVLAAGGEILKFLGDGFLAVFPIASAEARPCGDCGAALAAALAAQAANDALNRQRAAQDLPRLDADMVLHFGEVVYGNVGTRQRLDFTVIGRAVNEASRIERCCEPLGRSILCSDTFAARCAHPLAPVGEMPLRGLAKPHRLWAPVEGDAGAPGTPAAAEA